MTCKITSIEVTFPEPVTLSDDDQRYLLDAVMKMTDRYEVENPGRVMWPFGVGLKLLSNLYAMPDDAQLEFDESCFAINCSERADYNWPCAACGAPQGDHQGHILDPPAGRCEFDPKPRQQRKPTMFEPMMQFFAHSHLPPHLQAISKPFGDLAQQMMETLPRNPERTAGLRKLLEAKDCAVRAVLFKDGTPTT